jgi:hypothetical protein
LLQRVPYPPPTDTFLNMKILQILNLWLGGGVRGWTSTYSTKYTSVVISWYVPKPDSDGRYADIYSTYTIITNFHLHIFTYWKFSVAWKPPQSQFHQHRIGVNVYYTKYFPAAGNSNWWQEKTVTWKNSSKFCFTWLHDEITLPWYVHIYCIVSSRYTAFVFLRTIQFKHILGIFINPHTLHFVFYVLVNLLFPFLEKRKDLGLKLFLVDEYINYDYSISSLSTLMFAIIHVHFKKS